MNDLSPSIWLLMSASLLGVLLLTQCTSVSKPMRFNAELTPETKGAKAKPAAAAKDAWYIETKEKPGGKPYSCSFVEFDGRGDFIDFKQYQAAWNKVRKLGEKDRLLVVEYCHGWKNNSQSGDVVEFNAFLRLLANSPDIQARGFRVHGVYLAWRGNVFKPTVDRKSEFYAATRKDYGEDIINPKHQRWLPFFAFIGEQLSYWGRKRAAESSVAGTPLARAVFACANVAKKKSAENRVFLMGHSFGALLLEKSVGQALVGQIAAEYPWFEENPQVKVNPTPFDLMLMVNSAAPSIHSKQMSDVLWGHQSALKTMKPAPPKFADAPLVMSVTSSADWATGKVHPIGNLFAGLSPSLQRRYTDVLTDETLDEHNRQNHSGSLHQSYYYKRTTGHNPLLVDHWIVPEPAPPGPVPCAQCGEVLRANLQRDVADATVFFTTPKKQSADQPAQAWRVVNKVSKTATPDWNKVQGLRPITRKSNYWTIRCPGELISGHNDVWSQTTMEMYAALYRLALSKAED